MSTNDPVIDTTSFYQLKDFSSASLGTLNLALRTIQNAIAALSGNRGNIAQGSDINLNGNKCINSADPTDAQDLVTLAYLQDNYGTTQVRQDLVTTQQGSQPLSPIITGTGGSGAIQEGTHATRLATAPTSLPAGTQFFETDRTATYTVVPVSTVNKWLWSAGVYQAPIASIPSDLTTTDAGFGFYATDTFTFYIWTGSAFVTIGGAIQIIKDAATTTITTLQTLIHETSGTAGVGFGGQQLTELQNASGSNQPASAAATTWTNATAGSETSKWAIWLRAGGAALASAFSITAALLTYIGNIVLTGIISTYNNVATAGLGVLAIYAYGRLTAQTAAVPVASYTVGASDSSFLVVGNINVTTSTTFSGFGLHVTYTDETNASRTVELVFQFGSGGYGETQIGSIGQGAGAYPTMPLQVRAKAGTTVTMATFGTLTTIVYDVEASIIQIA